MPRDTDPALARPAGAHPGGEASRLSGSKTLVPLALALAMIAISFAAIFFRKAAPSHPLVVSAGRLAIAALVLLPYAIRAHRRGRFDGRRARVAVAAGALYAVHFGAWVTSLNLTSVAASVTLVTATPLLLALVAVGTGRDRPDRHHYYALGLALAGVMLIGGADFGRGNALLGDLLAFIGAATMAVYMLVVRRLGGDYDPFAFSGVACASGAVLLALTAKATGVPLELASSTSLFYVALAALLPQVVGHGLITWSLRHTRPALVGLAMVGEPVGSTMLAYFFLGESLEPFTALGCAVTLSAVVLTLVGRSVGSRRAVAGAAASQAPTPGALDRP